MLSNANAKQCYNTYGLNHGLALNETNHSRGWMYHLFHHLFWMLRRYQGTPLHDFSLLRVFGTDSRHRAWSWNCFLCFQGPGNS